MSRARKAIIGGLVVVMVVLAVGWNSAGPGHALVMAAAALAGTVVACAVLLFADRAPHN